MDSLIQLEYIIERERGRATGRQYTPADHVHIPTNNRAIDRLRRMLDLLRTAREAVGYA